MAAPCSMGRQSAGEATVLSTTSGMPAGLPEGGEALDVQDAALRVPDGLPVQQLGLRADRPLPGVEVSRAYECRRDAHPRKSERELRGGAAVEVGGGDDLIARFQQGEEDGELGRHPAGSGDSAGGPFQRGDPFLEYGHGGVADTGVDVAVLLQVEEVRGVVGVIEDVRGRLVDGHGAGADRGIGNVARVHHPGFESELPGFTHPCGFLQRGYTWRRLPGKRAARGSPRVSGPHGALAASPCPAEGGKNPFDFSC